MKKSLMTLFVSAVAFLLASSPVSAQVHKKTTGRGIQHPVLMGAGAISGKHRDWATTFMPDGHTVYFSSGLGTYHILYSKKVGRKWRTPEIASFSGLWRDTDPFISPDGKRLYFSSDRPADQKPGTPADRNSHIWVVTSQGQNRWSSPVCLDTTINYPGVSTWYPSESKNGNFYFHSWKRPGGYGSNDIYVSRHTGNKFTKPRLLSIDTEGFSTQEGRINADDNYLVFVSNRPGGYGISDIYISFHKDTLWSVPINLGAEINLPGLANFAPGLSLDGRTLYFANGSLSPMATASRIISYRKFEQKMDGIFNGLWNIFYFPLDIEKLKGTARW